MLGVARYEIGMMGWGYIVEALSVHSGVGLFSLSFTCLLSPTPALVGSKGLGKVWRKKRSSLRMSTRIASVGM